MIQYWPYIFGFINLMCGLVILFISFGWYSPDFSSQEKQEKFENYRSRFNLYLKLFSIFLICRGGYELLNIDNTRQLTNKKNTIEVVKLKDEKIQKENDAYLEAKKTSYFNNCINNNPASDKKYEEVIKEYCNCTVEKFFRESSVEFLSKNKDKPDKLKQELLKEFLSECNKELNLKVEKINKKSNKI